MIVHEQLSFQDALSLATKRIFETKGRSRRSEFWWAMLVAYFISNFLPPFWLVQSDGCTTRDAADGGCFSQ